MMYLKYQKKYHKVLSWILSLLLVLSLFAGINTHVNAAVSDSTTVLVFTSDVHNDPNDLSSQRLGSWIDHMKAQYGHINCMGFCGDMGWARDTSFTEDQYWNSAKVAFDVIATKGIDTCFTTGNHEHDYGRFSTTTRPEKAYFTVTAEAKRDTNYHYHIYCLGSASATSEYTSDQISALTSYFSGLGENDTDPVIVLTHYPLHYYRENYWTVRSTANADKIIDALNSGVTNRRKVVLLWGHNHTLSDTNYDKVKLPGSSVDYAFVNNSAKSKTIQFYYAAAGCMSDSEYSSGSQSVKGKGLALVFDSSKKLNFIYHNASGTDINKGYLEGWPGDVPEVTVSLNKATLSLQEEETFTLQATVTPESAASQGVTWSSSNSNVATVSSSGLVTAKSAGSANITVKTNDGNKTAVCAVTVTQPPPSSVTITWKNYNGNTIKTEEVAYGTKPSYTGSTPTRESTAQYIYSFSGWSPTIVNATQDATYTAQFSSTIRKYTITWKNYNGNTLKEEQVAYGTTPSYSGTSPTRSADNQYSYSFTGWSPEVTSVTGAATYTAQFTRTTRTYTITWQNYDGSTLETDRNVAYGTKPTYDGADPSRTADAQYSYTFAGWTPTVSSVSGNATYKATYTSTTRKYTVTWQNYDGSVLETDTNVAYGTKPTFDKGTPTREADAQYSYTFKGWDPAIKNVEGDITYMAQYTQTAKKYTVTWKNYDGSVLETDTNVEYGTRPSYNGNTPIKPSTAQYSYTFAGWNPSVANVTADATYKATYTSTTRKYTVTWKNYDGSVLETDTNVEYGTRPTYDKGTPSREADAQYSYTFKGWDPTVENVFGDVTYTAQYTSRLRKYTITWKNSDGTTLETDREVEYGSLPTYNGATPSKTSTNQYNYTFAGWTPKIAEVTGNAIYTAEFTQTTRTYTITWKNYDGKVLETDQVAYGTRPVYNGETPVRAATTEYVYTFSKWSPDIEAVSGDATYTATFTQAENTHPNEKYIITWKDYDDSILKTEEVYYGTTPSFGSTPTREASNQYSYTFAGWTPEIEKVTKDAAYTATYTRSDRKYTITWKDYDGSNLRVDELAYGDTPSYGTSPTRNADAQNTYTFAGWTPEIGKVTKDVTYTATYKSDIRNYTITWKDYNDKVLRTDEVEYGATPSYDSTPTRTATAQYSYTFEGWSPEITKVSGNATYTAVYTSSVRKYTITWENYDGSVLDTDEVVYGIKPVYSGTTPSRASTADYIYTFSGWSPEIANVSGNASYRATFTQSANTHAGEKYTITWKDYDGSILKTEEVYYGIRPDYGSEPTRPSTKEYSYTFTGWSPEIEAVTGDAEYTATYSRKAIEQPEKKYTITWKNYDGIVLKTEEVEEGKKPAYSGPDPARASTAQYSYTFIGWSPEIAEASEDTSYVAQFKETEISKPTPTPSPSPTPSSSSSKASASSAKAEQAKNTPPTVEEVKHAAVDSSLPVVNPEKIKTTASLKNATMKIELGTVNADYCLVEYKKSTGSSWKTATSTASGSVTLTGMKKNGLYQYHITTVKEENDNLKKGKTSNTSYRWINNTKITKGNSKDKQLNLAWKKVKGASGYEIQYSTDKDFKKNTKKKTVKNKKTEKTISGLKKGKTYYVRIRPVKKKDGKNYLGIFTNAKKVKIK